MTLSDGPTAPIPDDLQAKWERQDDLIVHSKYTIRDGELQISGPVALTRDPVGLPQVVQQFARVHTEEDLLAFTHVYGLLAKPGRDFKPIRLPTDGINVQWCLEHAAMVRTLLRVYQFREDLSEVRAAFAAHPTNQEGEHGQLILFPGRVPLHIPGTSEGWINGMGIWWEWGLATPEDVDQKIVKIIDHNLESDLGYRMTWGPLRLTPRFDSLRACIYWHLANLFSQRRVMRACEDCGALFVVGHGRQRFCPPDPLSASSTGSHCGARARQRRSRTNVTSKQKGGR